MSVVIIRHKCRNNPLPMELDLRYSKIILVENRINGLMGGAFQRDADFYHKDAGAVGNTVCMWSRLC